VTWDIAGEEASDGDFNSDVAAVDYTVSTTATAAGELFLFGGVSDGRSSSDLYVTSTQNF
jgi:hypothetical protein